MFRHKKYDVVNPAELKPDPAEYARLHDMVDAHDFAARRTVGAWRWPILHADGIREVILDWIESADRIIDFGGAAGPCGYGAIVVDRQADIRSLDDIEGQADLVFTAHTLEHVRDLGLAMCSFHWKLPVGGRVIAVVPSYTNESLRAENWPHHAHTFCMSDDVDCPVDWVRFDSLFTRHGFETQIAAAGFNNLIILAEKK